MRSLNFPVLASIKGWFSRNLLLKVTSLILGLFLWFHAVTDQTHQIDYPVPIELFVSDTTLIIVNELPSMVNVTFAGTGKELIKLWWKHPFIVKEVEGKQTGIHDLNLDVSSLIIPEDLNLIPLSIKSPTTLNVALDRLMDKEVRVASRLKVVPKEQYVMVGGVTVDPPTVFLHGAKGELIDVDSIRTVEGAVQGISDTFSEILPLDFSGFRTVTASVNEVTLSGRVEKYIEFELSGLPVVLKGRLKDKFTVQPNEIGLVVVGPVSLIQSLDKGQVEVYIEINDPPMGETYYSPMIELPDGIELLSEQPKLFKAIPAGKASAPQPKN